MSEPHWLAACYTATDLPSVRSLHLTSLGYIPHNLSLVSSRLHLLNLELAIIIAVFLFYVELYHLLYHIFLYHFQSVWQS